MQYIELFIGLMGLSALLWGIQSLRHKKVVTFAGLTGYRTVFTNFAAYFFSVVLIFTGILIFLKLFNSPLLVSVNFVHILIVYLVTFVMSIGIQFLQPKNVE